MNVLLLLISFCICQCVLGQINVQYTFRDACTGKIIASEFQLSQMAKSQFIESKNGKLTLDGPDLYLVSVSVNRNGNDVYFSFSEYFAENRNYFDTIDVPSLLPEVAALHSRGTKYWYCDTLASGSIRERYPNGKIRLEGQFVNGAPNGILKTYLTDGKLSSRLVYRDGILIKSRHY